MAFASRNGQGGAQEQDPAPTGDLQAGALNLLTNCAELCAGQRLLIIHEDPGLGWYDLDAPQAVATLARRIGAIVQMHQVGDPTNGIAPDLQLMIDQHDVTIFFARLGDQDRFAAMPPGRISVMSYARTAAALASAFGRTDHRKMVHRKKHVDEILHRAMEISITCPLGTQLNGHPTTACDEPADVAIRRFPMCVPAPVCADGFRGDVVVAGYLTPTGSRSYDPPFIKLADNVTARIEGTRIVDFTGPADTVAQVREHYARVAREFGIDPDFVHSWHAGIHADCDPDMPVEDNPDLWSNSVFGHPRWLHFHTCGGYAPGEICWMIERPTIIADGVTIWRDGALDV